MGWGGVISIVAHYGLDGSGIKLQWGRDFLHPSSLLYNGYWVSFPKLKWPGCGADHPPLFSVEVNEKYSCTATPPLSLHGLF